MTAFAQDHRRPGKLPVAVIAGCIRRDVLLPKLTENDPCAVDATAMLDNEGDVVVGKVSLGRPQERMGTE